MIRIVPLLVLALAPVMLAGNARARPPENADPALAPWFESLRAGNGGSCCSQADCRPVEYRTATDHYEALIDRQFGIDPPRWVPVPPDKILEHTGNPIGRAVACWLPYTGILCFVLPSQV